MNQSKPLLTQLIVLLNIVFLTGCCQVRFWKAKDPHTHNTYYTVDTVQYPVGVQQGTRFISPTGELVGLSNYELKPISKQQYLKRSGGSYRVRHDNDFRCMAYPVTNQPVKTYINGQLPKHR